MHYVIWGTKAPFLMDGKTSKNPVSMQVCEHLKNILKKRCLPLDIVRFGLAAGKMEERI